MMDYGYGQHQGAGLLILLLLILFFGVLVWFVVTSTHRRGPGGYGPYWDRGRGPDRPHGSGHDDPLGILDKRFAKGEIDDDEYQRRRKLLKGDS
jgi:putative membrane protein